MKVLTIAFAGLLLSAGAAFAAETNEAASTEICMIGVDTAPGKECSVYVTKDQYDALVAESAVLKKEADAARKLAAKAEQRAQVAEAKAPPEPEYEQVCTRSYAGWSETCSMQPKRSTVKKLFSSLRIAGTIAVSSGDGRSHGRVVFGHPGY